MLDMIGIYLIFRMGLVQAWMFRLHEEQIGVFRIGYDSSFGFFCSDFVGMRICFFHFRFLAFIRPIGKCHARRVSWLPFPLLAE